MLAVKNPPAKRSLDWEDPLGGGHDNPLQYSCLENPMDRGVWRTKVRRVTKSQKRLKWLSTYAHSYGELRSHTPWCSHWARALQSLCAMTGELACCNHNQTATATKDPTWLKTWHSQRNKYEKNCKTEKKSDEIQISASINNMLGETQTHLCLYILSVAAFVLQKGLRERPSGSQA